MSFISYEEDCHFPIENLPYGCFVRDGAKQANVGVAIGDQILDLNACVEAKLIKDSALHAPFQAAVLNDLMAAGRETWTKARAEIKALLAKDSSLKDNADLQAKVLVKQADVKMVLPANIGDYTDFYASREHATNVGTMFRGAENALMPNWLHIPIGYHGRASSIVVSGTPVVRPHGQQRPDPEAPPVFGPCKLLDMEIEMGAFVGPGNELGSPITIANAHDNIFGLVILNDWSARDIQKWEYQPLGPFQGKNWASTISPWVVTLDALEPFRGDGPKQEPEPLPYLRPVTGAAYDITLKAELMCEGLKERHLLATTNLKNMYWSCEQQLTHHSVSGCNMRPGDLLGTGTISGSTPDSYGSMLELCWKGTKPMKLANGEERKFFKDGDEVIMSGFCQGKGFRVGFGECSGVILPAKESVV